MTGRLGIFPLDDPLPPSTRCGRRAYKYDLMRPWDPAGDELIVPGYVPAIKPAMGECVPRTSYPQCLFFRK